MVRETSNDRYARLMVEGRWNEFRARREARVRILGIRPKRADQLTAAEFCEPLQLGEIWTPLPPIEAGEAQVSTPNPEISREPTRPASAPLGDVASKSLPETRSPSPGKSQSPNLTKEMFVGKRKSNPLKDIEWVANNLCFNGVDLSEAPSPAAAYLWIQCKYRGFESMFWSDLYPKIVPSKAAVEEAFKKAVDDGSVEEDMIDTVKSIAIRIRTEGTPEEKRAFSDITDGHEIAEPGAF